MLYQVYYRKATGILLVCDWRDPQFESLSKVCITKVPHDDWSLEL